jgi:hypothetical protein
LQNAKIPTKELMMRLHKRIMAGHKKLKKGGKIPGHKSVARADKKPRGGRLHAQAGGQVFHFSETGASGEPVYDPIRKTPDVEEKRGGQAPFSKTGHQPRTKEHVGRFGSWSPFLGPRSQDSRGTAC